MNTITVMIFALLMSFNTSCKKTETKIAQGSQAVQFESSPNTHDQDSHDAVIVKSEEALEVVKEATAERMPQPKGKAIPVKQVKEESPKVLEETQEELVDLEAEVVIPKEDPAKELEISKVALTEPSRIVEAEIKDQELIIDIPKPTRDVTQSFNMHSEWDKLLQRYVSSNGVVDYAGIKAERNRLDGYIAVLANNPPSDAWSKNKKLAYWINTYNAYTILLIVNNYPLKSIMDLEGGKPWDKEFAKVGGKRYSLNQIENDIIRPRFKEPRIHFAVNCAALSCPPLANQAFTDANLESLLTQQTTQFLNDGNYNTVSSTGLKLSKIFEWYAADFPDLVQFVSKYSQKDLSSSISIDYKNYDWALNGK